jgi:hypothetical protein
LLRIVLTDTETDDQVYKSMIMRAEFFGINFFHRYLAKAGYDPMIWSPSGERTKALAAGQLLKAKGGRGNGTGAHRQRL